MSKTPTQEEKDLVDKASVLVVALLCFPHRQSSTVESAVESFKAAEAFVKVANDKGYSPIDIMAGASALGAL